MKKSNVRRTLVSIFIFVSLIFTGIWVAIYNKFPTVYFDTGTYIQSSFSNLVPIDRPIFYSLFIEFARKLFHSIWGPIILQSVLVSSVLWIFLENTRRRITTAFILALGTSMSWFVSQLMPDIFTGTLAISFFLILFRWGRLSSIQKIVITGIFLISTLVHSSHWMLVLLLFAICFPVLFRRKEFHRNLIAAAAMLVAVFVIIPKANYRYAGKMFYSQTSHVFLLGRMVGSGVIQPLLSEHCSDNKFALCPYAKDIAEMHDSDYLWSDKSPLNKLGWIESSSESWKMIIASFYYYPYSNIRAVIKDTLRQLTFYESGDCLEPYSDQKTVHKAIHDLHPEQFPNFMKSRQQTGQLIQFLKPFRLIHRLLGAGSLLCLLVFLIYYDRRRKTFPAHLDLSFVKFIFSVVFLNAFVCATFSSVNDRYQSRVMWLVVLAVCSLPDLVTAPISIRSFYKH